jgi:hypothetical protein
VDQNEGRALRQSTPPLAFFFLVLPYGISSGFVSITLPFFLTRAGFSVAAAGAIVATESWPRLGALLLRPRPLRRQLDAAERSARCNCLRYSWLARFAQDLESRERPSALIKRLPIAFLQSA